MDTLGDSRSSEFQDALDEREARLSAVLDTAVDAIITIDERGTVESANAATERLFGWSERELVGRNVSVLMPAPDRDHHDEYLTRYLRTGVRHIIGRGREVQAVRRDGTLFPADLSVSEFSVAGRRRFTGIVRDVSARKEAEQDAQRRMLELAHASRVLALGEMTTGIAHEVNQPLAAIVSYAEACLRMLASGNADPEVLRDALEQIEAQGRRAGDVIRHLRRFVRKGPTDRSTVRIEDCIRNVLSLMAHELGESGVRPELGFRPGLQPVLADRVQIEQVVMNLVRNALEAMETVPESERRLSIATRGIASGGLEVSVRDTGPGLEGAELERIFDTFYTSKKLGTGVGLAISRSIVEAHGGRLWAEKPEGRGMTFRFTLHPESADED